MADGSRLGEAPRGSSPICSLIYCVSRLHESLADVDGALGCRVLPVELGAVALGVILGLALVAGLDFGDIEEFLHGGLRALQVVLADGGVEGSGGGLRLGLGLIRKAQIRP